MRGPLSLVIDDGNGERHVTKDTAGLRFKRSAYGGDIDLTCQVRTSRGTFTDLGPGSTVRCDDGRTGATVFDARAHQPGVTAGPAGELYDLQAFGGAVNLMAVTDALAYVHLLDEDWKRGSNSTRGSKTSEEEKQDGTPFLQHAWDKGYDIEAADAAEHINRAFQHAGLKVARLRVELDAGVSTADYTMKLMTGTDASSLSTANSRDASTTLAQRVATVGGGGIGTGDDIIALQTVRNGAGGVIPDKDRWFRYLNVVVRQLLKDKYGDNITTGYNENSVLAHEVIADMVGRGMCPGLDPDKVTIGTFSYAMDALSWLEGVKMADALVQLRDFEPNLTWQVYGDSGNFDAWPSEPRYVISDRDGGVVLPGEEISLADRVYVSWTDRRGRPQVTKVTDPSIPVKQEAEPISLPEGVGSAANAQRVGEKALELHNDPPKAGTAVVRRPILDRWSGALVLPHEVMPGCLAVHQETGDEYRVVETEYVDADAAVALTLGEPVRPLEAVIARLERGQRRRRRRR